VTLPRLVGMVHLGALPGAPGFDGDRTALRERALRDAAALTAAGFDALLVENYGDVPFWKDGVPPWTVAEMTALVAAIRVETALPVGVQVLRNDAAAALAVAAATGAAFIRVNVHTGAMLTDQGLVEGRAADTLRLRRMLGSAIAILADVHVKHAVPLAPTPIAAAARDAVLRGCADAVIVSGDATGQGIDRGDLHAVTAAVNAPVYVGSGATVETVRALLDEAHGVIAGSDLKIGRTAKGTVDPDRARAFVRAARGG
jgi:membrane complex biogenesis BtpA family protein